ncbi:hypothetical protein EMIHUDRAFT_233201 [Emiliania huxleyi CCMP1516]|uniref:Uncharacterized protein n=2 Tax=Emiliania huxleyi TaxID=2903 RepID=A0A0D3K388_EMIH1|nr:hypothetical protein EMIHUDRAFT_244816 [Emiliania huxleyi CCMP1516]XP_005782652.1 hypothetical protein EMIHUDRAFT_233201 [Emiliania huxleyi CCMP1516]EOD16663.1 hypothetical protein EMIHUDRAFT_244816 [Emiliania huxleyi CCMP1516]EOD30223.1 hypothetical protein EMIHUDRAFT_233201 [Emiliania huxleyi CCMP1516]|eukprot:XP_005769092.1 hypothetical protein EMIHUDRAFT_244816 [Emiliania huxleyi CCMP1516]
MHAASAAHAAHAARYGPPMSSTPMGAPPACGMPSATAQQLAPAPGPPRSVPLVTLLDPPLAPDGQREFSRAEAHGCYLTTHGTEPTLDSTTLEVWYA